MKRLQTRVKPAHPLRLGHLLAGACAGLAQAAFGGAPATDPAGHEPWQRLVQIPANANALRQSDRPALGTTPNPRLVRSDKRKTAAAKPGAARAKPAIDSDSNARELMQLPDAKIEERIAQQRRILLQNPRNEAARQTLGLIAVELGSRILELEALGRSQDLERLRSIIQTSLADTFWRTTQLAKSGGRNAAALGLFYSEGILTARDPIKGCREYMRAAQSGHVAAGYQSALCRAKSDPALANRLIERAAEAGHPGAQELLARACIEGETKDTVCAMRWLQRAASKGRPGAISLLAWLYANDPQRPDFGKAVPYYRAAAEAGDHAAQNNLGELYESGKGVPQDASLAFDWYARAAEAGFAPAQLNLARLYATGSGVARNTAKAREWAERALSQGQDRAREFLDWLAIQP